MEDRLIKDPSSPVLRFGENMIWDLRDLVASDVQETLSSNSITEPTKLDEDHLTFYKCHFNTRSLIYENASPQDVISAWKTVIDELKLDRILKLFLRDSMKNLPLTWYLYFEPDLVLILRLVYWYYYCKSLDASFVYKKKEVRDGLIKGRLKNREGISSQLDAELNDEMVIDLESLLLKNELQEEASKLRKEWFINTWNVTSELLFAGISGKNGFDVTFVPKSNTSRYDYDFVVDGFPAQVYSSNTPQSIESFIISEALRKSNVEENKKDYDLAVSMVKDTLHNKSSEIDYKLEQGAKIIFANGTSDPAGRLFSQHFFTFGGSCPFERSVKASMNLAESDNTTLPIVYCSTGFRSIYRIFTVPFKVRLYIENGRRKVDKKNDIEVVECP